MGNETGGMERMPSQPGPECVSVTRRRGSPTTAELQPQGRGSPGSSRVALDTMHGRRVAQGRGPGTRYGRQVRTLNPPPSLVIRVR